MSEYGGINMQMGKKSSMGSKSSPRPGAAKGMGGGLGGYNAGAVNSAMRSVVGSGGAPKYCVSGENRKK